MNGHLASRAGVAGVHSEAIDALFHRYDRPGSPGVNLAVISRGEIIHRRGYGVASIEDDVPFTADTVLRLGSTSKHLCAACVLILEDRGALALDDDARRHLPELPDYGARLTLRHLLTMTSGLRDGMNMLLFAGMGAESRVSRAQMLELALRQRELMFGPGDDCSYSNTNYALLSLVVERAAGISLGEFLAREIWAPLGMTRTALVPNLLRATPMAARGYVPTPGGGYDEGLMLVEMSGDGGIVSTLSDMSAWFASYRAGNLIRDLRKRLEAPTRLNDGREIDYRLGIHVARPDGVLEVRHGGGMPGFLSDFVYYPEHDLGVILFSNVFEPDVFATPDRIRDIVLRRSARAPSAAAVQPNAVQPIGFFANAAHERLIELAVVDDRLTCHLLGEAHPLARRADGVLESAKRGAVVAIAANENGESVDLTLGCRPTVRLTRVARPAPCPQTRLDEFAGRYRSSELGEVHVVRAVDGCLEVALDSPLRSLVWKRFHRVAGDLFTSEITGEPSLTNVQIGFRRDAAASVVALRYHLARCCDVELSALPRAGDER